MQHPMAAWHLSAPLAHLHQGPLECSPSPCCLMITGWSKSRILATGELEAAAPPCTPLPADPRPLRLGDRGAGCLGCGTAGELIT